MLLALLIVLVIAVAAVCILFFRSPDGLANSELTGFLPGGAEILSNTADKKTQIVEYTYPTQYAYCDVETSARLTFRYDGGSWVPGEQEELLNETENWTRLAGVWTDPEGSDIAVDITGFTGTAAEGTVSYMDGTLQSGPFTDLFGSGTRTADAAGGIYYQFLGKGGLEGTSLRVDRELGLLLNNSGTPMEKDAAPMPTRQPFGTLAIQREDGTETVETVGATPAPAAQNILITTAVLNVRPEPNTDRDPLATVEVATELTYDSLENGWYKVRYEGQTGYVSADYVQDLADTSVGAVSVLSATTEINVRSGPGTDQESLTTVESGSRMVAVGLINGWYKIRYNAGYGYVSAEYVAVEKTYS